jgi:hypothetical protein
VPALQPEFLGNRLAIHDRRDEGYGIPALIFDATR